MNRIVLRIFEQGKRQWTSEVDYALPKSFEANLYAALADAKFALQQPHVYKVVLEKQEE
jgi:hypothetical protein